MLAASLSSATSRGTTLPPSAWDRVRLPSALVVRWWRSVRRRSSPASAAGRAVTVPVSSPGFCGGGRTRLEDEFVGG